MRILSTVRKHYYGVKTALEPMYLNFTLPLKEMGHDVHVFDHYESNAKFGRERATDLLVEEIKKGQFDLVFYQTSGREPVDTSAFADLSRKVPIAAWNSDDDWQWQTTRRIAPNFTFMITTYPHIYEQNRSQYPGLLLSQWGCLGIHGDLSGPKDIDFSFVGAAYGPRNRPCRYLRSKAGLKCFGQGSRLVNWGLPYVKGILKMPWLSGSAIQFEKIYEIWNRSRVSYAPMAGGPHGEVMQIKARLFDMGLSGTLMLCDRCPNLENFYEPGKECVTFDSLEECAEKASWYLAHEEERAAIAERYRERTLREHMWTHRFEDLFKQMSLDRVPQYVAQA